MKKITKTEKEIMDYFWESEEELSLQHIMVHFEERNWSPQTVNTFLNNLVKKGFLEGEKKYGRRFYHPIISRIEYQQDMISKSVEKHNGMPFVNLIAAFCGKEKVAEEELKEIEQWLEDFKNK